MCAPSESPATTAAISNFELSRNCQARATPPRSGRIRRPKPLTIGITGPGGAGKTTLIDELILRHLAAHPQSRIAVLSHGQAILLEETGLFKFMTNALAGSPGMQIVERAVESAILNEFREIDHLGGVLPAITLRHQRSQIQSAAHRYERQIYADPPVRPIIGLNRYADPSATMPAVRVVRTRRKDKQRQIDRLGNSSADTPNNRPKRWTRYRPW
jgi:hypothetical protein